MRKKDLSEQAPFPSRCGDVRWTYDAVLGGGVVKKRIALPGRGKRGGSLKLIATNKTNRWFSVFDFGKTEKKHFTQRTGSTTGVRARFADVLSQGAGNAGRRRRAGRNLPWRLSD
jgi:hypothetical protein